MSYTPRTSRYAPADMTWSGSITSTNQYWYSISWNGGATASLCLPNCTTYARGRLAEIYGSTEIIWSGRSAIGFPNATNWHDGTLLNGWTAESTNYSPKVGDVACWSGGDGHVAIVEAIINGTVYVSESRYRNASSGTRSFTNPGDVGDAYFRYGALVHYSGLTFEGYLNNPHTQRETGTYTLSYSVNPSGSGYFTGSPQGTYNEGESITITAVANSGYTFVKLVNEEGDVYTNPSITRTMNRNRSYTAYFSQGDVEYLVCQMAIKKKKGQINEITIYV